MSAISATAGAKAAFLDRCEKSLFRAQNSLSGKVMWTSPHFQVNFGLPCRLASVI
jgi:hypothetical protein